MMQVENQIKKMGNNQVVVVLGMHRSGTSALTRSLQVLGIGLGDNLYQATPENPKGYWEDMDCIAINEELISHLGPEYDRLGFDWDCISTNPSINHLYIKAIRLVSDSIVKNHGVWGVKDPRMCRLLGFWEKVFDDVGCKVNYLISLRNPISVAKSLEKRNQLAPEKSYFLWLQHMVPAILDSDDRDRIVVDYDLLLNSPEGQIARIADHLKITFDKNNNALLTDFLKNFLDSNLRHSQHSLSQISLDKHLPHDALKAYELLLHTAKDEISINSDKVKNGFEQIQSNLQVYTSIFTYANLYEEHELNKLLSFAQTYSPEIYPELRKRWVSYLVTVPETEVEHLGFYQLPRGREEQISDDFTQESATTSKIQLIATLVERNGENANLRQTGSELRQTINELKQTVSELKQILLERNAQIATLVQTDAALSQTINERDRIVTKLKQEIADQQAAMDNITRGKAWRLIQKYWEIRNSILRLGKREK